MEYTFEIVYRPNNIPPNQVAFARGTCEAEARYNFMKTHKDAFVVSIKKIG